MIHDAYSPQNLNPYSYCVNNPLRYTDPAGDYEVDINEVKPGDIGLQRAGSNTISNFPKLVGESYGHGIIALDVIRNEAGAVNAIRIGDMRLTPQNQMILTDFRNNLFGLKFNNPSFFGERIQDYDFFRVTNSSTEAALAVARADSPTAWDFTWDPKSLILGTITKKDYTYPFDNKMLCTEYLNFLYNYKFKDPQQGATLPSDIYYYQQSIAKPYSFSLQYPQSNIFDNLIPNLSWIKKEE